MSNERTNERTDGRTNKRTSGGIRRQTAEGKDVEEAASQDAREAGLSRASLLPHEAAPSSSWPLRSAAAPPSIHHSIRQLASSPLHPSYPSSPPRDSSRALIIPPHISSSRSVVLVTSSLSPAISPACRPPAAAARPLSSLSRNVRARAPKRSRPRHALRHALLSRRRARDASRELCTRGPAANPNPNPTPPPPRATPPSRELCAREPAAARRPVPCAVFTRLSSGWRHVHGGQPVKHCATSLPPSLSPGLPPSLRLAARFVLPPASAVCCFYTPVLQWAMTPWSHSCWAAGEQVCPHRPGAPPGLLLSILSRPRSSSPRTTPPAGAPTRRSTATAASSSSSLPTMGVGGTATTTLLRLLLGCALGRRRRQWWDHRPRPAASTVARRRRGSPSWTRLVRNDGGTKGSDLLTTTM